MITISNITSKNMNEGVKLSFKDFLSENLSHSDFEKLNEHLGESSKATTMLLENPRRGTKLQLEKITQLLRKFNPIAQESHLVDEFGFGVTEEVAA
jgi:hypothetical protein